MNVFVSWSMKTHSLYIKGAMPPSLVFWKLYSKTLQICQLWPLMLLVHLKSQKVVIICMKWKKKVRSMYIKSPTSYPTIDHAHFLYTFIRYHMILPSFIWIVIKGPDPLLLDRASAPAPFWWNRGISELWTATAWVSSLNLCPNPPLSLSPRARGCC